MYRSAFTFSVLVAVLLAGLISTPPAIGQQEEAAPHFDPVADVLGAASFRHVGPVGNRVPAVVGIPGDLSVDEIDVGAAGGGPLGNRTASGPPGRIDGARQRAMIGRRP